MLPTSVLRSTESNQRFGGNCCLQFQKISDDRGSMSFRNFG